MGARIVVRRATNACASGTLSAAVTLAVMTGSAGARDIELGRYLAAECMTCHRATTAAGAIPNIFGTTEPTFAEVVRAYKDKRLANPVMQTIAGRLNDEEIAALAAYFSNAAKR
jgi:cytochrome c